LPVLHCGEYNTGWTNDPDDQYDHLKLTKGTRTSRRK